MSEGAGQDLELRRRKALYRAHHRGTKEMDILLGRYAEARLDEMDEDALGLFERLLALPDPDVQKWILSGLEPGEPEFARLVVALRRFHGLA